MSSSAGRRRASARKAGSSLSSSVTRASASSQSGPGDAPSTIIRASTSDERGNLTYEHEGAYLGGLDQALAALLPDYSRSRLKTWIEAGEVLVDGATRKPKVIVAMGATAPYHVADS